MKPFPIRTSRYGHRDRPVILGKSQPLERIWNKRPDGFAIKMPTTETAGEFVILEFKRMSCVTARYVTRARNVVVAQYASIKSALERTLNPQGWTVSQRSFIAGARSLNEKDLHDNLAYFKVPQVGIESIRSKLAFKIFVEYSNILKGMYSTRFNGRPKDNDTHTVPSGPLPPLITSLHAWQPNNIRRQKEKKKKKGVGLYQHTLLHTLRRRRPTGRPIPNPHVHRN
jgi:hypothetical protein